MYIIYQFKNCPIKLEFVSSKNLNRVPLSILEFKNKFYIINKTSLINRLENEWNELINWKDVADLTISDYLILKVVLFPWEINQSYRQ